MKNVKHILTIFLHSFIPQDSYYPKLLHIRLSLSLNYYFSILSFFAIILTGSIVLTYSPMQMMSYKNSVINSLSAFPEKAIINIENGVLESNQNKPLFMWVYHNNQPLFVFMIHTKDILTHSYIPLPLVFFGSNKAQIFYRGKTFTHLYGNSLNAIITKERIQSIVYSINSLFPLFLFVFYLSLIIVVPIMFIMCSTFVILLSSSIVFVLFRMFIPSIRLKKCIQAGIHGTHIPLCIVILLFALFPFASNIFPVTISLIFVFILVSTYEMYSKKIVHSRNR